MSGLSRTPGKRVGVNSPPRVRIPLPPPGQCQSASVGQRGAPPLVRAGPPQAGCAPLGGRRRRRLGGRYYSEALTPLPAYPSCPAGGGVESTALIARSGRSRVVIRGEDRSPRDPSTTPGGRCQAARQDRCGLAESAAVVPLHRMRATQRRQQCFQSVAWEISARQSPIDDDGPMIAPIRLEDIALTEGAHSGVIAAHHGYQHAAPGQKNARLRGRFASPLG